jgi:hypothetical protein
VAAEVATLAVNGKARRVILEGSADGESDEYREALESGEVPSSIYRRRVAERRVTAVGDALIALGIDPQIISTEISIGDLTPGNIRDPLLRRVVIKVVIPV